MVNQKDNPITFLKKLWDFLFFVWQFKKKYYICKKLNNMIIYFNKLLYKGIYILDLRLQNRSGSVLSPIVLL